MAALALGGDLVPLAFARPRSVITSYSIHYTKLYEADLKERYAQLPKVFAYLEAVEHDILENADDFRKPPEVPLAAYFQQQPVLRRYEVNLLVDHSEIDGAPVVMLDHPTYPRLV